MAFQLNWHSGSNEDIMKNIRNYFFLAALLMLCLPAGYVEAQSGDVAVIVNPDNPVTSISMADLHRIFGGDKQSWGGFPAVPFVRAAKAHERDVLLSVVMKMTEAQFQDYWVKKVYSGSVAHEPLALMSNGMQLEAIRSQKGGIALISLQDVKDGVKVIKVDGVVPGSSGYPLK
jgi:ABC-type phosphate transport system substrate-binding protein